MCYAFHVNGRDIRPTDNTEAITAQRPSLLSFGFRLPGGKLVANARAETAEEKPLFRDALEDGRVLIPADSFYEWDRDKVRHTFSLPGGRPMHFAGLRRGDAFVILTTAANACMAPVHGRMPLIVEHADAWLFSDSYRDVLRSVPPELERAAGIRQGRLF